MKKGIKRKWADLHCQCWRRTRYGCFEVVCRRISSKVYLKISTVKSSLNSRKFISNLMTTCAFSSNYHCLTDHFLYLPFMISIGLPYGVVLTFGCFFPLLWLRCLDGLLNSLPPVLDLYTCPSLRSLFSAYFFTGLGEYLSWSDPLLFMLPDLTRCLLFYPEVWGDRRGDSLLWVA